MALTDVDELIKHLNRAEIEPTAFNISALKGMLDLGVFDLEDCLLDLKNFIEGGAIKWE